MELETCHDGIQNQDEAGIDCGGRCPNVCGKSIIGSEDFIIISASHNHYPLLR